MKYLTFIFLFFISVSLAFSQQAYYNKIAFSRMQTMNDWDIWIMNRDGTSQTMITDNTYRDTGPCFNPQGTKIVFGRVTSTSPIQADIYIMNPDGTGQTNLTNLPEITGPAMSPKFSWNGGKIVFDVMNTPGNGDIYMLNYDGTGLTAVLTDSGDDSSPHFSPDGQWVVFMRQIAMDPNPKAKICKVNVTTHQVVDLTSGNYLDETPVFSTDGNYVLFKRGFTAWDLYRMSSNHNPAIDTDLVNMTNQSTWAAGTAMYSWEGDKIVYYTSPSGPEQSEIYIMNTDGSNKTKITNNTYADFDPTFSPLYATQINNQTEYISKYSLEQNYPNPFNPKTLIRYQLPAVSNISIKVYDIYGRELQTLVNQRMQPGSYEVTFDGTPFSSGIYFYRIVSDAWSETKRMILIK